MDSLRWRKWSFEGAPFPFFKYFPLMHVKVRVLLCVFSKYAKEVAGTERASNFLLYNCELLFQYISAFFLYACCPNYTKEDARADPL